MLLAAAAERPAGTDGPELAAGATVRTSVALPVPPLFAAASVIFELPAVPGVPEIKPVEALKERPAGRGDAPKLVGLFVAVI